jgi:hypothetical protein
MSATLVAVRLVERHGEHETQRLVLGCRFANVALAADAGDSDEPVVDVCEHETPPREDAGEGSRGGTTRSPSPSCRGTV